LQLRSRQITIYYEEEKEEKSLREFLIKDCLKRRLALIVLLLLSVWYCLTLGIGLERKTYDDLKLYMGTDSCCYGSPLWEVDEQLGSPQDGEVGGYKWSVGGSISSISDGFFA
jgi:hypothetical protein